MKSGPSSVLLVKSLPIMGPAHATAMLEEVAMPSLSLTLSNRI